MNRHSIGFKIGFWSGLILIALGCGIAAYAAWRMNAMAAAERAAALEAAEVLVLNAAKEQATVVKAALDEPLTAARTLARALVTAARKEVKDLTEADWARLSAKYKAMEIASELAVSTIRPFVAAAASGAMPLTQAQKQAIEAVRKLRYQGDNYIWIHEFLTSGVPRMIMHPIKPELEGKPLDDAKYNTALGQGRNLFVALNDICATQGAGYIHYDWFKPGQTEMTPKLSYGRLLPEWNWVLGSGIWIDEMAFYSRADIEQILVSVLRENPGFLGVYTAWEPNAFDGQDALHAGQSGTDASGRFIPYWTRGRDGKIAVEPLLDYEKPGVGDYYLKPKSTKREQNIGPLLYPAQGQNVWMTSLVAPVLIDGAFRGIAGVDIPLAPLQTLVDEMAKSLYDGRGRVTLATHDAVVIAASGRPGTLGQSFESMHEDAAEALTAIRQGTARTFVTGDDLVAIAPIRPGRTETPWGIELHVPLAEITADADRAAAGAHVAAATMIAVALVASALGVAAMMVLALAIARRIRGIASTMHDIATSGGDLTRALDTSGHDELAALATAFNRFQDKMRELVAQTSGGSERLAAAAEQLSATSDETGAQIRRQQSEADQVATAMNEMAATVAEVARNAAQAAAAAHEADQRASGGQAIAEQALAAIQSLTQRMEQSAATIGRLSGDAEEIGKVLDVIRGIAEQTNLLALNAAIEAARAGEQGRGFAVVADEVRTLASRTQDSTKEIQAMIERLQSGARSAVKAMEEARAQAQDNAAMTAKASGALAEIGQAVATIKDMNTQIASATEEQTAVAEEVDRNLTRSTQAIESIASGATQIQNAAIELAQLAANQLDQVGRFKV